MHAEPLDAQVVRSWCRAAADDLYRAREALDTLNVFPVADADTGTNMHLTMTAAADAPASDTEPDTAARAWAAVARAAMLGAHGNSGVILSQLLRGVAEHAPTDGATLARALRHAADVAYAAVGDPVEGTMLTVASAAAGAAEDTAPADVRAVAAAAADGAWQALQRTPDQLAVLADAGVVDAGAAGLVVVLDALARVCAGGASGTDDAAPRVPEPRHGAPAVGVRSSGPAYEVMYLLDAYDADVVPLRARLGALGDSLVVVGGDGVWNVHVHVDDAGAAVEAGLAAGRPHRVRVTHLLAPGGSPPARRVVAVVPTAGLGRLVEECGAVPVVGTPEPDALCDAVTGANATEAVLLPDSAASLGAVAAAVERLRAHGVRAAAVPARALVQSLAALAVHEPGQPHEADLVAMTAAAVATRHADVPVDGADPAADAVAAVTGLLAAADGELVTLVTGPDVPAGLADTVADRVRQAAPGVETVVYEHGPGGPVLQVGVE